MEAEMTEVKIEISIPESFLEEIDRVVQGERSSRDAFFYEAARLYLQTFAARPAAKQALALMDELSQRDQALSGWDVVRAVRRERERNHVQ